MKITPTIFVSLGFVAGFGRRSTGGNIISPANAIEERVILINTDAEIANSAISTRR